jgi:hypothetical protein
MWIIIGHLLPVVSAVAALAVASPTAVSAILVNKVPISRVVEISC